MNDHRGNELVPRDGNGEDAKSSGHSVLTVIRSIHSGTLEPKSLGVEARQRCVEHLTGEGYSIVEIAEVLKVSERTIARDRAAIRQANALTRDPALVGQMAGELLAQAETAISRIRRVTRERATPAAVRVDGEKACWTITRDLVQRLQSLGYLPTAPQEIRGDVTHRLEETPGYDEIQVEVARLEVILSQDGVDPQRSSILNECAEVKDVVTRLALSDRVRRLTTDAAHGNERGREKDEPSTC